MAGDNAQVGSGYIARNEDGGRVRQQGKPAGDSALGPEQGTRGNGKQEKLGIVLPVIGDQHSERGDGGKRDPCVALGSLRAESYYNPQEHERARNKKADGDVDAWIVAKHADESLQTDNGIGLVEADGCGARIVEAATHSGQVQIVAQFG